MPHRPLAGRLALITGASRGLGLAIGQAFAQAGARLALVARDTPALARAVELIQAAGDNTLPVPQVFPADLADDAQIERALAACLDSFGGLDILVNNAAIQGQFGPLDQVDWQGWRGVIQVNLLAPARICQLVIPAMRACGYGKIINLSGGGATGPRPDLSAYASAKCGLVRLSETLAEELRGHQIDVNCVAPGALNTGMLDELLAAGPDQAPREYARALKQAETGGTPLEKATALITWLASPASDGISGRLLSAVWDDWPRLVERRAQLDSSDVYTLRRIVPGDRGLEW
jgi:3-oxoacyl-[acyl-carrier protein] reductase